MTAMNPVLLERTFLQSTRQIAKMTSLKGNTCQQGMASKKGKSQLQHQSTNPLCKFQCQNAVLSPPDNNYQLDKACTRNAMSSSQLKKCQLDKKSWET
jgi:hypothetical protein